MFRQEFKENIPQSDELDIEFDKVKIVDKNQIRDFRILQDGEARVLDVEDLYQFDVDSLESLAACVAGPGEDPSKIEPLASIIAEKKKTEKKPETDKRSAGSRQLGIETLGDRIFACFHDSLRNREYIYEELLKSLKDKNLWRYDVHQSSIHVCSENYLTPGEIFLLAGSMFSARSFDEVITFGNNSQEQQQRFNDLHRRFTESDLTKLSKFAKNVEQVAYAIEEEMAHKRSPCPSAAFFKQSSTDKNKCYEFKTLSEYTYLPVDVYHRQYKKTWKFPFDKYGMDAKEFYKIAHSEALATAKRAKEEKNERLLMQAFVKEIFAIRFLYDGLSAGHIRTPYRGIYEYVNKWASNNKGSKLNPELVMIVTGLFSESHA